MEPPSLDRYGTVCATIYIDYMGFIAPLFSDPAPPRVTVALTVYDADSEPPRIYELWAN